MYYGDIRLGDTIDIKFTTRQISGAPSTLGGTPAVSAYVGNGTTQITAGITLTADFDAVTGLNNVRVVASSGNGFATATNVQLVITTGTVNSVSVVGEVIGSFSIEARSAVMPTTAARTLDVSATGEAGIDWANIGSPTTAVNLSGTNIDVDQVVASVSGAVGSVTATVNANAIQISGDTTAADNLETAFDDTAGPVPWLGILDQGTAQAATSTTLQLRAAATFADDTILGAVLMVLGSTQGYWQVRTITDYVSSTDTATVDAWGVTPSGTITYKVFAAAPASATVVPAVNVTQWLGTAVATPTVAGVPEVDLTHVAGATTDVPALATNVAAILVDTGTTLQAELDGIQTDTEDIQSRLPAALVSGRIDASVGAMAANTLTASALATDAVTEIQTGLATSAALATAQTTLTKLETTLQVQTGSDYQFTANALALAPSGSGPTLTEIVDGVWDEPIAGHLTAGTTGAALNGAGSAGDPWTTPLPGAYGAGTAGFIVGTNLDAQVSAVQSDTDDIQTRLPAALVAGRMDSSVGAMAADTLTSSALAASAVTEIQAGLSTLDAAGVRTAVGLASANLDTQLSGIQSDTNDIQTRLPAALVSGRIDASVGAMAANVLTAAATAADFTAEIQVGLATAAALTTVGGNVTAVKAKTDSLAFTVAGQVDANVQYVNDVLVTGNGQPGTEWGP